MSRNIATLFVMATALSSAGCAQLLSTNVTRLSSRENPYDLVDGYILVQKIDRRNTSTEWKLVWEDEFDKKRLDTSAWTRIGLFQTSGWWKTPVDQWQKNTSSFRYINATDERVVQFDGDNIYLRGIVNTNGPSGDPRPYLTGGIETRNKLAFQYGRIEVRAKLEPAYGAWPAIWMMSEKNVYPDQHNGEMDIMERLNHDTFAFQTIHTHWTLKLQRPGPNRSATGQIDADGYNVYSVSWYPEKLVFAINGKTTFEYPKVQEGGTHQWPFDQPFFLFVNQQLEGWPGKVTKPEELPIDMIVDWVRLYQ